VTSRVRYDAGELLRSASRVMPLVGLPKRVIATPTGPSLPAAGQRSARFNPRNGGVFRHAAKLKRAEHRGFVPSGSRFPKGDRSRGTRLVAHCASRLPDGARVCPDRFGDSDCGVDPRTSLWA
jgi:hypothetical protein